MTSICNFLLLASAAPAEGPAPNLLMQIMPLILIGVIFYFLLIRPQQKQRKEHQALVESLKTGDKVVTNAGIHGLIANVKDKTVVLKIAENVKVEFDKSSVVSKQAGEEAKT